MKEKNICCILCYTCISSFKTAKTIISDFAQLRCSPQAYCCTKSCEINQQVFITELLLSICEMKTILIKEDIWITKIEISKKLPDLKPGARQACVVHMSIHVHTVCIDGCVRQL